MAMIWLYNDIKSIEKVSQFSTNVFLACYSLSLIAYRNIKAGEELTIDYGYEEIYEDCKCGKCKHKK